ncbi:MAG: hypothetical protein LBF59_10455 [Prevotellaceae bacterium]|jgi:hypothetical protein|nr:hypothetical protein [Prevotellaceae bacterium]
MEATKEQIAEWQKKHGDIYCMKVEDRICYLKKPSRKAIGYASMAGKDNPLKFNETLLNDCWLAGDEEIKTDDTLFLSVSARIGELIEIKNTELVKL